MMSAGAAFIVRNILESGGHPDQPFIESSGPRLAWKTGTSFGFRDAWAVGVGEGYTLGVWIGRPDGTPNPGFFGANIAAPLLKELVSTLPRHTGRAASRKPPASVRSAQICWPLGGAAERTSAEHCHVKRSAWILHDTIPPTLPDRVRSEGLQEAIWIDPANGRRTLPQCKPGAMQRQIARWPTLLDPWLSPAERQRYGLPDWSEDCQHHAPGMTGGLRIVGIQPAERIRPVPGARWATLKLRNVGGTSRVHWLLDGKLQHSGAPGATLHLRVDEPGTHRLSVVDASGAHDSLVFSFTP